jgi:CRISPR-associated protein Csb2
MQQTFPLGRFHATPWRAFAFDDPHGEWPPSPWRLLRAILARSFQLSRELPAEQEPELEQLREKMTLAFCASSISWQLPTQSWRGPGIQQYQPSEFKKIPPGANEPGEKTYNTTKIKDNFWLTPEDAPPLFWILDGDSDLWTNELLKHLDACLARMTYFGRAESITSIKRVQQHIGIIPNCILSDSRSASTVPVLCPTASATLAQVACMTNEDGVADATTPPGAVWKYAERPAVSKCNTPNKPAKALPPTSVLQFAIGGRVFPPLKVWLRITERFRGAVLRNIVYQRTGDPKAKFGDLPHEVRAEFSLLTGKDAYGQRLSGHRHVAFFLIPDNAGRPSRLICYREEPFSSEEQIAMLAASVEPLAWDYSGNGWRLRLVPLPTETPLPPDKNVFGESRIWETLIPYVPPLHVYRENGKPKSGAGVETQILSHLVKLVLPSAEPTVLQLRDESVQWMKVHRPRRSRSGPTNDDKRAYRVRITFSETIRGPLFLGHSSHFGLGLFGPTGEPFQGEEIV